MNEPDWQSVQGIIQGGHKVASGQALNSPYPNGTIAMQIPFFRALGLNLGDLFRGTLNVSIQPLIWEMTHPALTFSQVMWTDKHPPEDFSFSACLLLFNQIRYPSWIYYPHPKTKKRHFQNPSVIEIIAPLIKDIKEGHPVIVEYNSLEITVKGL